MKIMGLLKGGVLLLGKHKSAILSGTAIVTAIGTIVMTVKATVKSVKDIEELKEDKYVQANENLNPEDEGIDKEDIKVTPIEVVKVSWKHYIPVAIGVATTVICIICAHRIDAKRIAAATSALMLSEKMNKELEHKTIEEFGKEKLDQIKEKVFHENADLRKVYVDDKKALHREILRDGDRMVGYYRPEASDRMCWFKDPITARYFWASKSQVEKAVTMAMRQAINNGSMLISLNDFYDYLDLEQIDDGYNRGWDLQKGRELDISYEADIAHNGEPCLIMHYHNRPLEI